jgi:hypothetical protein
MFLDIIKAYADAMYVATTLRPPVSAAPTRERERFADGEQRSRARLSSPLAGRIAKWLRTRLGRGFGANGPRRPLGPHSRATPEACRRSAVPNRARKPSVRRQTVSDAANGIPA